MSSMRFPTLLLLSLFVSGCGNSSSRSEEQVLGAILPLTGALAPYGQSGREGVELAFQEFQATHPGTKIRLVIEDDRSEVGDGISALNKLIAQDKAKIVVGAMASGVTLAIAPIANRNRVVLIAPTSTASDVTNAGDYIFRVCVSDAYEGPAMARYLARRFPNSRIGITYINNAYGTGLRRDFLAEASRLGLRIVADEGYPSETGDFRPLVTKLQGAGVDVLYLVAQKEQTAFLRAARQIGFRPTLSGSTMIEDPDLTRELGEFVNGVLYTYRSYDPTDSTNTLTTNFVRNYTSKYGREPDFYAASAYDAARVALNTITSVPYESEQMKAHLYALRQFPGVTGSITFDANGDVLQEFRIKTIENGRYTFLSDSLMSSR